MNRLCVLRLILIVMISVQGMMLRGVDAQEDDALLTFSNDVFTLQYPATWLQLDGVTDEAEQRPATILSSFDYDQTAAAGVLAPLPTEDDMIIVIYYQDVDNPGPQDLAAPRDASASFLAAMFCYVTYYTVVGLTGDELSTVVFGSLDPVENALLMHNAGMLLRGIAFRAETYAFVISESEFIIAYAYSTATGFDTNHDLLNGILQSLDVIE